MHSWANQPIQRFIQRAPSGMRKQHAKCNATFKDPDGSQFWPNPLQLSEAAPSSSAKVSGFPDGAAIPVLAAFFLPCRKTPNRPHVLFPTGLAPCVGRWKSWGCIPSSDDASANTRSRPLTSRPKLHGWRAGPQAVGQGANDESANVRTRSNARKYEAGHAIRCKLQ